MSVTDPAPQADQNIDDVMEEDADLDANIDAAPAQSQPSGDAQENEEEALLEAREPTKKDVSLRDFLGKMDDYAPIVRCGPTYARTNADIVTRSRTL